MIRTEPAPPQRPLSASEAHAMITQYRLQRLSNQSLRTVVDSEQLPARTREWVAQRMWPIVFLG